MVLRYKLDFQKFDTFSFIHHYKKQRSSTVLGNFPLQRNCMIYKYFLVYFYFTGYFF